MCVCVRMYVLCSEILSNSWWWVNGHKGLLRAHHQISQFRFLLTHMMKHLHFHESYITLYMCSICLSKYFTLKWTQFHELRNRGYCFHGNKLKKGDARHWKSRANDQNLNLQRAAYIVFLYHWKQIYARAIAITTHHHLFC